MPKCQCPERAYYTNINLYEPEEYKAMQHEPNECPGDYNVSLYNRNGQTIWLCSCCNMSDDIVVKPDVKDKV